MRQGPSARPDAVRPATPPGWRKSRALPGHLRRAQTFLRAHVSTLPSIEKAEPETGYRQEAGSAIVPPNSAVAWIRHKAKPRQDYPTGLRQD
jgi:hypothetical protein